MGEPKPTGSEPQPAEANDLDGNDSATKWPASGELCPAKLIAAPHPAWLDHDDFLAQCQLQALRRGGPGGQHRNKVSSAVRLLHTSTGVAGEANERRDQSQNLSMAIQRLRLRLAVLYRTEQSSQRTKTHASPVTVLESMSEWEVQLRQRYLTAGLKVSDHNPDYPAVLALLLDDLHRAGGQPHLIAPWWQATSSAVIRLIAKTPPALVTVNQWRAHHGRHPLKPA